MSTSSCHQPVEACAVCKSHLTPTGRIYRMLRSTEVRCKHATSSDTLVMCISSQGRCPHLARERRNLEGQRSPTILVDRARFRGFNLFSEPAITALRHRSGRWQGTNFNSFFCSFTGCLFKPFVRQACGDRDGMLRGEWS